MFRSFARKFLPNRLDWMLKRASNRGCEHVVLGWNRGLGDIALGLYAIVHRIRERLPKAKITVLTRENLKDGFSLLPGVECVVVPGLERGKKIDMSQTVRELYANVKLLYMERPSPTDWCYWQYGTLTPRLTWNPAHEELWRKFGLVEGFTYVGVQVSAETQYGFWRNWPLERWNELFDKLSALGPVRVLLFGHGTEPAFSHPMIVDLRGKTTLFELLSIIKNRCFALVLPDSGILSMTYYLDASFPLRVVSLWADPNHGILKQRVASPNPQLEHRPLIAERRDLSLVSAGQVFEVLFPKKRRRLLRHSPKVREVEEGTVAGAACVILAGGQGSRLGVKEPKGFFLVLGKSLFQRHLEKIPSDMPVAVMVSPLNQEETIAYFERHDFFGRKVSFFCQDALPLLDEAYRETGLGPDGNGGVYERLVSSGLLDQWKDIDTLLITNIDNPLADPADRKLLSYHRSSGADVTIQCIERILDESMGLLVEEEGRIGIAEYVEGLKESEPAYSYTGQIAVSSAFVQRAAQVPLPYHWIRKELEGRLVWKREKFLFDAFSVGGKIQSLCYPRRSCYAPIKGPESIAMAEKALKESV